MSDTQTPETIRTADVVAFSDGDQILLIERKWEPHEGEYALPGGHVDVEEGEETGVRVAVDDLRYLGRWDEPGRDPRGDYRTDAYLVRVPAGTAICAGDDAASARWWPVDALPPLAFDHADIVEAALREVRV